MSEVVTEERVKWDRAPEHPFTQVIASLYSEQKVWVCSNFHFQLHFLANFVDFRRK